jgi:CDGSH-type Zn-finger protein/truncated hemoglobin YjbI
MSAGRPTAVAGGVAAARDVIVRAERLGGAFEAAAAAERDPARRESLGRVAGRLAASVVRPLSGALASAEGVVAAVPDVDPALEIDRLAIDATALRVRIGGPAALLEAVAALQDLSCQLAGDEGSRADRRREFADLQAGLGPSVEVGHDGPYLVTNVGLVDDWLGVSLEPTPQIALCRCGASESKPWCDGSHALVGFSGVKAADRVEDREDSYPTRQVTITDNRGLCAHSGFCTDRAPNAFRAHEEPFVAPAGDRLDQLVLAAKDCPSGALGFRLDGVDPDGQADSERPPAIEVSKDGPYRLIGRIDLAGDDGGAVARDEGASLEHFSLCRCGKSRNKPFCSGMHWYADFHDPAPPAEATLFQWLGGYPALLRLTRRFYEVHVAEDPFLAPLFARMSADHPERVAAWLTEVFGGPSAYTGRYGGYDRMISQHLGRGLREEWRRRWVALLLRSADEVGLPADPEFRAAFVAYLEWGSRIAVENSAPGVEPPPHMPVPRWWWVCDTVPWSRAKAAEPEAEAPAVALPGPDEPVVFADHVKPLFRPRDRDSMRFAFDLWAEPDVAAHGEEILGRLRAGTMPCDGAWPPEWVEVLERWVATSTPGMSRG